MKKNHTAWLSEIIVTFLGYPTIKPTTAIIAKVRYNRSVKNHNKTIFSKYNVYTKNNTVVLLDFPARIKPNVEITNKNNNPISSKIRVLPLLTEIIVIKPKNNITKSIA